MTSTQPNPSRLTQTSFHLLAKPTGAICNLDCTYCFFLSKDALYPGDRMRMTTETLESYLKQLLASQPDGPVSVAWQGGEPTLMGLDFYKQVIEFIKQYARPTQIIEHTMQAMVRIADRFVVLDHGSVLAVGKPMEVTKDPSVIEAYLGKKWMDHAKH